MLPASKRDEQDEEDDKGFRKTRDKYLANGTYSMMSKRTTSIWYSSCSRTLLRIPDRDSRVSLVDDRKERERE